MIKGYEKFMFKFGNIICSFIKERMDKEFGGLMHSGVNDSDKSSSYIPFLVDYLHTHPMHG